MYASCLFVVSCVSISSCHVEEKQFERGVYNRFITRFIISLFQDNDMLFDVKCNYFLTLSFLAAERVYPAALSEFQTRPCSLPQR